MKIIIKHFSVCLSHAGIMENSQVLKEFNDLKERTQKDKFWKMKCKEFWQNIYHTEYEKYSSCCGVTSLLAIQ